MATKAELGVIGLAVMGRNLALNAAIDNGFRVCVYNRTTPTEKYLQDFLSNEAKGVKNIIGAETLDSFVEQLEKPRRILLMIQAGKPVDEVIASLTPLLDQGDIIMDGGNSEKSETTRRCRSLSQIGLLYMGVGISGGEEGARNGPSMMPGGNPEAWPHTKHILQAMSAKVNGKPCCNWIGGEGAGHYVKTVHNGIGYADMQILAEAYHMLKTICGKSPIEISQIFENWNLEMEWRLLQSTVEILRFKDSSGEFLVEKILDAAAQKGTGKWAVIEAVESGIPATLISESVAARSLSALKDQRVKASQLLAGPTQPNNNDESIIEDIKKAVYASKIILYAQGFMVLKESFPEQFGSKLDCVELAHMWRGGCVIRSVFMDHVKNAFMKDPELKSLVLDDYFSRTLSESQTAWRKTVVLAINHGVPVPIFSAALSYYDGYRCARLPANLLQALRDYYGAHTFQLLDQPGVSIHNNWKIKN